VVEPLKKSAIPATLSDLNGSNEKNKKIIPSLHLSWKEQKTEFGVELLNFFQNGTFVDVTLICDGNEEESRIGAHKIILASYSEYFRRILEESPCKHSVVVLKGFSKREVEVILQFMYRGEVKVNHFEVESLLRAADALQVSLYCFCFAILWFQFRVSLHLMVYLKGSFDWQFVSPLRIQFKWPNYEGTMDWK
jgi:hypothetical protein